MCSEELECVAPERKFFYCGECNILVVVNIMGVTPMIFTTTKSNVEAMSQSTKFWFSDLFSHTLVVLLIEYGNEISTT